MEDLELFKYPLKNENFTRKEEIGKALTAYRAASDNSKKSFRFYRVIGWSVAASVILLIGLWGYSSATVSFSTDESSMLCSLPDNSIITINQHSSLSYNKIAWLISRTVNQYGKVKYEVTKGFKFSVKTDMGTITVLGTVFSVDNSSNENLIVECNEGLVVVKSIFGNSDVSADELVTFNKNGITRVSLLSEESPLEFMNFNEISLSNIIRKLEDVYSVSFVSNLNTDTLYFSGSLPMDNIGSALDVLCKVCNINYSIDGKNITLLSYPIAYD